MTHVIDVSAASYVTAAVVAYYVVLYVVGRSRPAASPATADAWPVLVVVIPARNEERVIERTVRSALECPYPGHSRVLVMDDASTDATADIVEHLAAQDDRVRVCHRAPSVGGRGKSDVLNHAYRYVQSMVVARHEWLQAAAADDICMCIVDADGQLSPTAATDAVTLLCHPGVAAVQIGVQIRNARQNLLARLQDIEFVGFSFMVQTARDRLGSVGLGGNGQFTRLTALADLGDEPWRSQALTEDLDLGGARTYKASS
jgi:cellulose synthase/poly-beta-1,6-N-acetylglucosamine synthase-like glycosyltransferase